jgi:hypothetical protein
MGPEFAQHVEYRPVEGLPLSAPLAFAEGRAASIGYVRLLQPPATADVALLALLADAHWPAIYVTEQAPRPMATLSFQLDLLGSLAGVDPAAPLLVRTEALAGCDGYVVEDRTLFALDGRLLATNRQIFVLIK